MADHLADLSRGIRSRLIEERRREASAGRDPDPVVGMASRIVEEEAALLSKAGRTRVLERVLRDTVGLGPLEDLLTDPAVEEVMVNGPETVYVGRAGRVEPTGVRFDSEEALRTTIERILAPLGRRVDESMPAVDARLADGSRVHAAIPPLAVDAPVLTIRRFTALRPGPEDLVASGTVSSAEMDLLARAVSDRRTVLVSGGTASGKTTLLNALSSFLDPAERIVTIEDAAELRLVQSHVVRLEARPPTVEGRGELTTRDLLRNALRMRPDRIIVGEVRGPEALDLLQALNTGHEGSLTTIHANSAHDALERLLTLCLMAGVGLPADVLARQIRRAVGLVVHLDRDPGGGRRLVEVLDVGRGDG